jgi:ubiquinone/menaquinone biosynthesis C-methylase UbiE
MSQSSPAALNVEEAVRQRYSRAAESGEAQLCCPTSCDAGYLSAIPTEVLERDYGCGDPSRYLRPGETVLDLGAGAGKICFLASQIVGPTGKVVGIDMNDDMLAVARRNAPLFADRIGYANVSFGKGKIQDLRLDLEALEIWLGSNPLRSCDDLELLEEQKQNLRHHQSLVPDESIDVVISNCVLNLVHPQEKHQLFTEVFRVLRRGGRAVISDIVSDEDVPPHLQNDPELWSGCISGALREDLFLRAFEDAGFYGITILERQAEAWRTVEGIEFRSVTIGAYKGKEGACWDQKQAVIYRGPFREVQDDDGHILRRGVRVAVCEKTFGIYSREPYRSYFDFVEPLHTRPPGEAPPFPCSGGMLVRDPRETKGQDHRLTTESTKSTCGTNGACC